MITAEILQRKFAEDRRLVILRFLAEEPDYRMNTSLMCDALDVIGHRVSRDVVATDAAWLQDNGLVTMETLGHVTLLKLTERGADVAAGRATVPGVKRPSPSGS